MSDDLVADLFLILTSLACGATVAFVGHRWGAFAAAEAVKTNSTKWKAYTMALILPLTIAFVLFVEPHLSPFAFPTFSVMAAGATFAVLTRYHNSIV
jgi:hypothetical protein